MTAREEPVWGDGRRVLLDLAVIILGLTCAVALLYRFIGGSA